MRLTGPALLVYTACMSKAQTKLMIEKNILKLWIATIALSIIVFSGIGWLWSSHVNFRNTQLIHNAVDGYNYELLKFCYDNDVRPCNDEGIWDWNEKNPTNTFDYKTSSQVIDTVPLSRF